MEKGLKNLQSAGRNAFKRERTTLCEEDSGIAGMDAEPGNTENAQMIEEREELDRRGAPDQVMRRTSFEMPSIASILHSTPQSFVEKRRS